MRQRLCSVLPFILAACLHAQSPSVIPILAGPIPDPSSPSAGAPTFTLIQQTPGAHPGRIWVRSTSDGLYLTGKIDVDPASFHWPTERADMLASDHIEVWLAASTDVPMPPIDWLPREPGEASQEACADMGPGAEGAAKTASCRRWFAAQPAFRDQLKRLFVRQWLVSGSEPGNSVHAFEEYATAAYGSLRSMLFTEDLPAALEPKSRDGFKADVSNLYEKQITLQDAAGHPYNQGVLTGYQFRVFIPYSAFPPTHELELRDLWLMVDVVGAAPTGKKMGAFSTTSAARRWGDVSSFNHLRLASPPVYTLSPCEYPLAEAGDQSPSAAGWIFPTAAGNTPTPLAHVYHLENSDYLWAIGPSGTSPQVTDSVKFWTKTADGAFVCGPELSYRKGSTVTHSGAPIDSDHFQIRSLADGWKLVMSGPTDEEGQSMTMCGGAPNAELSVHAISPSGKITSALDIDQRLGCDEGAPGTVDFTIAPDWSRIVYFQEFDATESGAGNAPTPTAPAERWTSTTYCLNQHAYSECGHADTVKPPDPPHFKEFRDAN